MNRKTLTKTFKRPMRLIAAVATAVVTLGSIHSVHAINLAQVPLFLTQPVRPIVMLNMSNDHQLFFKAYDDYSDLDGDGIAETTYKNSLEYYGYFNSDLCYEHSRGMFSPVGFASNYYCDGKWSGNFLNWATMTRMDAVRKILYGGKRREDSANYTVLERAFLPQDAHAFAKYYNGDDLSRLTPFSVTTGRDRKNSGLTICNTTEPSGRNVYSQNVTAPPIMRVAAGNYSLWASNETWQCRWNTGSNGNNSEVSKINAYSSSPGSGSTYNVLIKSCVEGYINDANKENCRGYADGIKPAGLLQEFGEDESVYFGLMTGSYNSNKAGGVLRKNVSSMTDEVNLTNGTFKSPPDGSGIVGALDAFRIVGYSFSSGNYDPGDSCPWISSYFSNGKCSNWGNPQSEIYLESLRYLAGKSPSFGVNDSNKLSDLKVVDWVDPINNDNYCAPLTVLQFNASTSSYDNDNLGGASDIGLTNLNSKTDNIGTKEGITGKDFFVGTNGTDNNQVCTPKKISNLSSVTGTCPDAPRLEGSYQIAGLAHHARVEGIGTGRETVQTFGVALAPSVPKIEVKVPGKDSKVTILPACREARLNPVGNCAIVDFKLIDDPDSTPSRIKGSAFVNWESNEQGGDYDQDMWGMIWYEVTANEVTVTTKVMAESTGGRHAFGYVLSGTTKDGFHAHSGIENYKNVDEQYSGVKACGQNGMSNCNLWDGPTSQTYEIGGSSASLLEQPLYYAAKWGGFDTTDEDGNEVTEPPAGDPESYFYATNPGELADSLREAMETVVEASGAASAVATNSTRLGTDSVAYQATFNTANWSGDLIAANLGDTGLSTRLWSAANRMPAPSAREIFTHNGSNAVEFEWGELNAAQKFALNGGYDGDGLGEQRVAWTRGQEITGFKEREDNEVLGDVVNSNPKYSGAQDFGFAMSKANGHNHYADYVKYEKTSKTVFVGANDGMLHAFNAETGVERFAYIPSTVYEQLKVRTDSNYGSSLNPHKFSVDGQVFVGDAYFGNEWRTILVGTMGAGAKGIFALDISDPDSFNVGDVLFEYNATNAPAIGNINGTPIIAPMPDGSWAVVTGNGYNSQGGKAQLVIIPLDGTYTPQYIDTGVAGDNGLSEPAISVGGGFLSRYAYAGDLKGNMYKFDLQTKSVSYTLFKTDGQPITASPILGINPYRKYSNGQVGTMVYFGTGSYMTLGDLNNEDEQSFYGIADTGEAVVKDDLFRKYIISESPGSGRQVYEGEGQYGDKIDWETKAGWYLDFDTVTGERVVDKPILSYDRLIFPTVIPTESPCDFGGRSWIMALIGVGGLYSSYSPFAEDLGEGGTNNGGGDAPEGLADDTLSKLSTPTEGGAPCGGGTFVIKQNSDGTVEYICTGEPDIVQGRQSWRQIQ